MYRVVAQTSKLSKVRESEAAAYRTDLSHKHRKKKYFTSGAHFSMLTATIWSTRSRREAIEYEFLEWFNLDVISSRV